MDQPRTPTGHLDDDTLSELLDDNLPLPAAVAARRHLAGCVECQARFDGLVLVQQQLRELPEMEPGRSFLVGPRPAIAAGGAGRWQRWYAASRALSSALAAVFLLVAGMSIYTASANTRATASSTNGAAVLRAEAPTPASTSVPPARGAAAPAAVPRAAAPASAQSAPAPAANGAVTGANDSAAEGTPEQRAASVASRPLPTATVAPPPPAPVAATPAQPEPAESNPWPTLAVVCGILAAISLASTFFLRARARAA